MEFFKQKMPNTILEDLAVVGVGYGFSIYGRTAGESKRTMTNRQQLEVVLDKLQKVGVILT